MWGKREAERDQRPQKTREGPLNSFLPPTPAHLTFLHWDSGKPLNHLGPHLCRCETVKHGLEERNGQPSAGTGSTHKCRPGPNPKATPIFCFTGTATLPGRIGPHRVLIKQDGVPGLNTALHEHPEYRSKQTFAMRDSEVLFALHKDSPCPLSPRQCDIHSQINPGSEPAWPSDLWRSLDIFELHILYLENGNNIWFSCLTRSLWRLKR